MIRLKRNVKDGTPCAVKIACTVWSGGKLGDYLKELPITINPLDRGNFYDKQRRKESNAVQRNIHGADNSQ